MTLFYSSGMSQVPEGLKYFPAMWFKAEAQMSRKDAEEVSAIAGMPIKMKRVAAYMLVPSMVSILALLWLLLRYSSSPNKVYSRDASRQNSLQKKLAFVPVNRLDIEPSRRSIIKNSHDKRRITSDVNLPAEVETLVSLPVVASASVLPLALPQYPVTISK